MRALVELLRAVMLTARVLQEIRVALKGIGVFRTGVERALVELLRAGSRCGTGVRPEEAFSGKWCDVDRERRMFRVRRALSD